MTEMPNDPPPDQKPDPQPPKSDWLRTMARATETVAPLVKPVAPDPENLPQDQRGRWAAVLASFSILVAATKFVLDFFNLVSKPLAPLAAALPAVASVLFAAGFCACVYIAWRAPAQRRRFAVAAAILGVIGLGWGGWTGYDALRPPAGFRILVGEFDGQHSGQQVDFARRITDQLRAELATAGVPIEIRRSLKSYADEQAARSDGVAQKAGMVIWGWYDDLGVSPHVEVLQTPGAQPPAPAIPILFATASAAGGMDAMPGVTLDNIAVVATTPPTALAVDLYAIYGPNQLAYVAASVLGLGYLANGDAAAAHTLFDKALANAAATGGPGQEVVLYQRALLNYHAGDLPAARTDLETALHVRPDFYEAVSLLSTVLADGCTPTRDLATALAAAETATTLRPADAAAWRMLAEIRLRLGDSAGALIAAQEAQQRAPADATSYLMLAATAQADNQPAVADTAARTAADLLRQRIDSGQATPQTWFDLGDVALIRADWTAAADAYRSGLSIAPADERGQIGVGQVLYKQGQTDAAENHYRTWAAAAPTTPTPHLLLGVLLAERNTVDEALRELRLAAQFATCDVDALKFEGAILLDKGDLSGAEDILRQAQAREIGNPQIELLLGAALLAQGRAAEAAPLLKSAIVRHPGLVYAHYALGQAYEDLGEPAQAEAAFAQVVALSGPAAPPTMELAVAYEEIGQPQQAIAVYRAMLAQQASPEVHAYLAELYAQTGAADQAIAELRAALALDAENAPALLSLGNLLMQTGDQAGAAEVLERFAAHQDSVLVRTVLAQLYASLGQPRQAAAQLAHAATLDPADADIPRAQAELAIGQGELAVAEEYLDQAMRLRPDDAALHADRSDLAYRRCNLDRAVLELERAVALKPDSALYRSSLAARYLGQERADAAAPLLAALQTASDTDFMAHLAAAGILATGDDLRDAEAEMRIAAANAGTEPLLLALAQAGLGAIYQQRGDLTTARASFGAAIASNGDYAPAHTGLGELAMEEGEIDAALAHFAKAEAALAAYGSIFGGDQAQLLAIHLIARRGLARAAAGDADGAAQAYVAAEAQARAALSTSAEWPDAHFVLGAVLASAGRDDEAAAAFDAAIACDATFAPRRAATLALLRRLN